MKTQFSDLAAFLAILALAIVLPILAGAELDRAGFHPNFVNTPAII